MPGVCIPALQRAFSLPGSLLPSAAQFQQPWGWVTPIFQHKTRVSRPECCPGRKYPTSQTPALQNLGVLRGCTLWEAGLITNVVEGFLGK